LWLQRLTTKKVLKEYEISDELMGVREEWEINDTSTEEDNKLLKPTLVATGIKSYMEDDEALFLYNRSSNPLKLFLLLANGVGVVDSDYYGNPKNDGHIMFQFINFGFTDRHIKKGQAIGQGIFKKFLKADKGTARQLNVERTGGHGSTK
jgi:dUTP pyrophosphatase